MADRLLEQQQRQQWEKEAGEKQGSRTPQQPELGGKACACLLVLCVWVLMVTSSPGVDQTNKPSVARRATVSHLLGIYCSITSRAVGHCRTKALSGLCFAVQGWQQLTRVAAACARH